MNKYKTTINGLFEQTGFPDDAFYIDKVFADRKIIIYGAGGGFHWVKEILMNLYGYIPSIVLDQRFKRCNVYEGISAFSPLDYHPDGEEKQNAIVIICTGWQELHAEIVNSLKDMGFQNIIFLMDIYEIHNPFRLPLELQTKGFDYFKDNKERILACFELFADDMSREIYTRCLQTHMTRKPAVLPANDPCEQYTPSDVPLKKGYSRYVYCGVSSGEMERVLNDIGTVEDFVCFEPNAYQFKKVVGYFKIHRNKVTRNVFAYPCAVYSGETKMPFIYTDDSFGNRISENGKSQIQCVSIDNVIPGFNPTFISMDIEGTEPEALKGAENTIKASRPDLAVCVYHSPDHLWEIPLYLHSLGLGYKFYLRNYTTFTAETVLYAAT